jgi:hypothetical protein
MLVLPHDRSCADMALANADNEIVKGLTYGQKRLRRQLESSAAVPL